MALEEDVTQLRKKALAQRRQPVSDAYQGVSKERVAEVLREIDRYTPDCTDTVFALLDDEHDRWPLLAGCTAIHSGRGYWKAAFLLLAHWWP